jgi:glycosyltransferase involved in cell wall biosynthesis
MTQQPWCSIVIPAYNYAAFLSRAIESALAASGPSKEVIVVDDGSTDDTAAVANRYQGRIRFVRQDNRGVSAARNNGIAHAHGQYVVCLDADDRLTPEALPALYAAAEEAPQAGIIFGHSATFDSLGNRHVSRAAPAMSRPMDNFRRYVRREFSIGAAAIRSDVFRRLSFPVGVTHGEDLALLAQVLALYDAVSLPVVMIERFDHGARARHQLDRILRNSLAAVEALFRADLLPPEAMACRAEFTAFWLNDLARAAFRLGDRPQARRLYHAAMAEHWPAVLCNRHFGRYLRTYLPQRRAA